MTFGQRAAFERIAKLWSEAPAATGKRHVTPAPEVTADCSAVWGATALVPTETERVGWHRPRAQWTALFRVAIAGCGLVGLVYVVALALMAAR